MDLLFCIERADQTEHDVTTQQRQHAERPLLKSLVKVPRSHVLFVVCCAPCMTVAGCMQKLLPIPVAVTLIIAS